MKRNVLELLIFAVLMISCSKASDEHFNNTDNGINILGKWKWIETVNYNKDGESIYKNYHGGFGFSLFFGADNFCQCGTDGTFQISNNKLTIRVADTTGKSDDGQYWVDTYIIDSFDETTLILKENWQHVDDDDDVQRNTSYILHKFTLQYRYLDNPPEDYAKKYIGKWKANRAIASSYYYCELKEDGTLWGSTSSTFESKTYMGTWEYDAIYGSMLFNAIVLGYTIPWKITSSFEDYWSGETLDGGIGWTFQRIIEEQSY